MPNERFLMVSYLSMLAVALGLSVATYLLLGRSFRQIAQAICPTHLARLLRSSFPLGMILLTIGSCLAVNYLVGGCSPRTYDEVVADRGWIVQKNLEQAANTVRGLILAILAWDIVTLLVLTLPRAPHPESGLTTTEKNPSPPSPE
jgi:hypothetical protein